MGCAPHSRELVGGGGGGGHTGAPQEPYSLSTSTQRACLLQSSGNGLDCVSYSRSCAWGRLRSPTYLNPSGGYIFSVSFKRHQSGLTAGQPELALPSGHLDLRAQGTLRFAHSAELDGGTREAAPGERARAGAEKGLERCSGKGPEEGMLRHAQVCSWQRG